MMEQNDFPSFSVLMSVYYKEKPEYLRQSIASIINQTLMPNEIVIVKDGKIGDALENVLKEFSNYNLKIIGYEKNMGLGYALNYGVVNCSNDIIARMDSDDIAKQDRFEKEIKYLVNNGYDLVGSNTCEFIDSIDNIISQRNMPETSIDIIEYSHKRNPFIHPSIMTYKSKIIKAGNYQSCYLCEDYDMWTRMIEQKCKCYNIQENLVYMRVGKDFYRRRGGIKYCKAIISFKKKLYKRGYMQKKDYLKSRNASIVISLMPGFLREFVYKKFLRG